MNSLTSTSDPDPIDAIEGIVKAFDSFPIVALGEPHGLKESADFIAQLIRYPDFSAKCNDIVVEFGNAFYQDVIDRYVAGAEVPRAELQQAWRNTTQYMPAHRRVK